MCMLRLAQMSPHNASSQIPCLSIALGNTDAPVTRLAAKDDTLTAVKPLCQDTARVPQLR
jgi:hypothetical protein